ncbi:MAG: hypothetical protein AAFO94_05425, partial [Bacteroidota bacterium]
MKTTHFLLTILCLLLVACKSQQKITDQKEQAATNRDTIVEPTIVITDVEPVNDAPIPNPNGAYTEEIQPVITPEELPEFSISGTIRNGVTGAHIANGELRLLDQDRQTRLTLPIVAGSYAGELAPGCYEVKVWDGRREFSTRRPGFCVTKEEVQSKANFSMALNFETRERVAHTSIGSGNESEQRDPDREEATGDESGTNTNTTTDINTVEPSNPTSNEEVTIAERARQDARLVETGEFRYDPIPPLPIDTQYTFVLEIVPGKDSVDFKVVTGNEAGAPIANEIRIASEMAVHIISPNEAFDIRQISATEQTIDPFSSTIWTWVITPQKLGKHPVLVSIDIITRGAVTGEFRKKSIE